MCALRVRRQKRVTPATGASRNTDWSKTDRRCGPIGEPVGVAHANTDQVGGCTAASCLLQQYVAPEIRRGRIAVHNGVALPNRHICHPAAEDPAFCTEMPKRSRVLLPYSLLAYLLLAWWPTKNFFQHHGKRSPAGSWPERTPVRVGYGRGDSTAQSLVSAAGSGGRPQCEARQRC